MTTKYILWLDEVGRWPLAGPVAVGGVFLNPFPFGGFPLSKGKKYGEWYTMITDSKQLNAKKREYLAWELLSHPDVVWATSFVSAKYIDRYGIVAAIRKASLDVIDQIIQTVTPLLWAWREQNLEILLDGKTDYWLRKEFWEIPAYARMTLQTIVKWDSLMREIGAASIVAKVQRDEHMTDLAHKKKYQAYGFDRHKGYGTLLHRTAIAEYGLSDQHRKSFCTRIMLS